MIITLSASLIIALLVLAQLTKKLKDLKGDLSTTNSDRGNLKVANAGLTRILDANQVELALLHRRLNDAEYRRDVAQDGKKMLFEHNLELAKRIAELEEASLENSALLHIKFTARMPNGDLEKTIFKLGEGPCGLTVKAIKWNEYDDHYILEQLCTNGEIKRFKYDRKDVLGRIEQRLK